MRDLLLQLRIVESLIGHVKTGQADIAKRIGDPRRARYQVVDRLFHFLPSPGDSLSRLLDRGPDDGANEAPSIGRWCDRLEAPEPFDRGADVPGFQLALGRDPDGLGRLRRQAGGLAGWAQCRLETAHLHVRLREAQER